jgi:hypothetical protein
MITGNEIATLFALVMAIATWLFIAHLLLERSIRNRRKNALSSEGGHR